MTTISKQDNNLWKAYNAALREHVFRGGFNPKIQTFHTAPLGTLSIPCGDNVPTATTNMSIYKTADTLLDPSSPFMESTGSYIDRQQSYLGAVQFKKNTNRGADIRLQSAIQKKSELESKMNDITAKARNAFEADAGKNEKTPFRTWVSKNYPQYDSLNSELQQATNAVESASIDVYGPGAQELNRRRQYIAKAKDFDNANQGLNMKASDSLKSTDDCQTYRPSYTIDRNYTEIVKQWSTASRGTTINIDVSKYSSEPWSKSGFPDKVNIDRSVISAITSAGTEYLDAEKLGEVKVSLSAAGIKMFDLKPGAWDGDFTKLYGGKDVSISSDYKPAPACVARQVVMACNISLDITLDSNAAKQVSDLYQKNANGGTMSFFGMPISVGSQDTATKYILRKHSDDFSSFSIVGESAGQPVILGVAGFKLAGR